MLTCHAVSGTTSTMAPVSVATAACSASTVRWRKSTFTHAVVTSFRFSSRLWRQHERQLTILLLLLLFLLLLFWQGDNVYTVFACRRKNPFQLLVALDQRSKTAEGELIWDDGESLGKWPWPCYLVQWPRATIYLDLSNLVLLFRFDRAKCFQRNQVQRQHGK